MHKKEVFLFKLDLLQGMSAKVRATIREAVYDPDMAAKLSMGTGDQSLQVCDSQGPEGKACVADLVRYLGIKVLTILEVRRAFARSKICSIGI